VAGSAGQSHPGGIERWQIPTIGDKTGDITGLEARQGGFINKGLAFDTVRAHHIQQMLPLGHNGFGMQCFTDIHSSASKGAVNVSLACCWRRRLLLLGNLPLFLQYGAMPL
jgi:hypothetical protein